ncbi:MAG: TrwC relaxase, partial [Frankiales bacterium]|nr:TrwC relaxase [Frankiales bacterium]
DSRALHKQAKTAGYLYQAALRHELSREFGVTWNTPVNGMAEIEGVPREVLREFSTRRRQIESVLAQTGGTSRAAAQAACLATRQRKTHLNLTILREGWAKRTSRLGSTPSDVLKTLVPRQRSWQRTRALPKDLKPADLTSEQVLAIAGQVLGPAGVTAQRTGFDRRDLIQALAVTVPLEHGGDARQIEVLADQLLTRPDTVPLEASEDGQQRWTTLELLATEYRALKLAATTSPRTADDSEGARQVIAARPGLSLGQREAIRLLDADDRFVRVLVGPAGSGKTAVLSAARDLASLDGRPVVGCALAALTAQRLQQASGVPSSSLASLLARIENGLPLEPRSLLIVDEAAMVGTRDLARLFEHVHQAQGRVLLVGDPEQLPEIDAGGLFRHLSQPQARPALLVGNQRQQAPWEAGALELLRANSPVLALGEYARHDRLTLTSSRDDMHDQIADDYLAATADSPSPRERRQTVVLASHRIDVQTLNQTIRAKLQQTERLGPDLLTVGPEQTGYALGDEVIVTKQCHDTTGRKILNGTRGTVTHATSGTLRLQTDNGAAVDVDVATVSDALQHGYALTIHKAQGLTATRALIVSDGLTRQSAYTALSRGRERNQLYLHDNPDAPADAPSPFTRLCEQLGRNSGDTLAGQQLRGRAVGLARRREYEPPSAVSQSRAARAAEGRGR